MIKIELECEVPTDATHYRLNISPDNDTIIEWWARCKSGWAIWNGVYWELRLPLEAEDATFFKEITIVEPALTTKL